MVSSVQKLKELLARGGWCDKQGGQTGDSIKVRRAGCELPLVKLHMK